MRKCSHPEARQLLVYLTLYDYDLNAFPSHTSKQITMLDDFLKLGKT